MAISKEFIVSLKGKEYPVWAGVLNEAHKAGLRSLTTELIQIPSAENGHMAIVKARAEFEDGRVFEDLGDCSPASTSPMLVAASIRLASTRAKGRVLRDAVNVGQTLLEELPDLDDEDGHAASMPARGYGNGRGQYATEPAGTGHGSRVAGRESTIVDRPSGPTTRDPRPATTRVAESPAPPLAARPAAAAERAAGHERSGGGERTSEGAAEAPMVCSTATCGKALTKGQYEVSLRAYGQPLCPACQKLAASRA